MEDLLAGLTLEEKASLCVGRDAWTTQPVERLGIPSVWMADGPSGLRKARRSDDLGIGDSVPSTCFPTESALGASWDVALVQEVAAAIAREARAEGVGLLLGPGINLKRSPLGGRNFEYLSEDPVLSGRLAAAFVRGLQDNGVGACLKHFVANEQETDRLHADSVVDERTLREVYLRPFEIAVAEADPWAVMAAYNRVNGEFCAESGRLLRGILAEEWGYRGIVVSDWLAVNDRVAGMAAGLHLQMPHAPTAERVADAVRSGRLAEDELDAIVRPLLAFAERAARAAAGPPAGAVDAAEHHALARRAAAASVVLLKNDGGLLPLDGDVALIGAFAKAPRYQGAGSSEVVPTRLDTLHGELSAAGVPLEWAEGGERAVEAARRANTAVVCVGLPASYETEGLDRRALDLPPDHVALVEAVAAAQPRTVVVLHNGAPVSMPWAARVPAIVEAWLGGQAGAGGLADVLTGAVNPSGKLAETFPARLADTPAHLGFPGDGDGTAHFGERLFTGHRWYDARGIEPLFCFGHGLSYTEFAYEEIAVDGLDVRVAVRNAGDRAGAEVVQLYVQEHEPALLRPERELRAFAKVELRPGERAEVAFRLTSRDFATYDVRAGGWRTGAGKFTVLAGASSRDLRLSVTLRPGAAGPAVPFTRLTPMRDWLADPLGREVVEPALAQVDLVDLADDSPMMRAFVDELPAQKLVMLGALGAEDLDAAIARLNGVRRAP